MQNKTINGVKYSLLKGNKQRTWQQFSTSEQYTVYSIGWNLTLYKHREHKVTKYITLYNTVKYTSADY